VNMNSFFDSALLSQMNTKIGKSTRLSGDLAFQTSMKIEGCFFGTIRAKGFLFISETAEVEAEIEGVDILIAGSLKGNIQATGRVELLETARVYGNIKAEKIRLLDGVLFEGHCEMLRRSDTVDIFALPLQELKVSLEEKKG